MDGEKRPYDIMAFAITDEISIPSVSEPSLEEDAESANIPGEPVEEEVKWKKVTAQADGYQTSTTRTKNSKRMSAP